MSARILLAALLALPACIDADRGTLTAAQVFRTTVGCGAGPECRIPADGRSPVAIALCLTTERDHADTVPATVRAIGGEWRGADADHKTSASIDLTGTTCPATDAGAAGADDETVDLSFVPGRAPGLARVETTVGSYTSALEFWLVAAPLAEPVVRPAITDLSASHAITIAASVHTPLGDPPTTGTRLEVAVVDPDPADSAWVFPSVIDPDASGAATTTLQTATGIRRVTVRVTATAPTVDGYAPPTTSTDIVLTDVP